MKKRSIFLIALTAFFVMRLSAQYKPVVVIAPFDAKGVSKDEADVITEIFTSEYAGMGKANVVDRNSFDKIRAQLNFQSSDWSDSDKIAQLGKALNASQVVVGRLLKFHNTIVMTVRVIDINTTIILSAYVNNVDNIEKLFDTFSTICKDIAEKARGGGKVNPFPKDFTPEPYGKYKVDDEGPGGGIVFYVSEEGFTVYDGQGGEVICHYLEMSKTSSGNAKMDNGRYWVNDDDEIFPEETALGFGKSNSYYTFVYNNNDSSAAYLCSLYVTDTTKPGDWFLPSKDELYLIYKTQRERILADRGDKKYWSSTLREFAVHPLVVSIREVRGLPTHPDAEFYCLDFNDGSGYKENVKFTHSVRAVRAF